MTRASNHVADPAGLTDGASNETQHARALMASAVSACAADLADMLAAFFSAAGVSNQHSSDVLRAAADRAADGHQRKLALPIGDPWVQLSDAIVKWWRDPEYLDETGWPRDLPDRGPAPSIDALLAETVDATLREQARELLRRTAATETDGTWQFARRNGSLPVGGGIESARRLQLTLNGVLRTFLDNQTRLYEPSVQKNFDSAAHVAAFPVSMIPELRAKLHKRLHVVLDEIDSWMTSVASQHRDGPVALVGLSACMYTSDPRSREGTSDCTPIHAGVDASLSREL